MNILVISNNTYPMQGPRAFRTSELSEQLAKMGHKVVLYTVHGKYDYTSYEEQTGICMKDLSPKFATNANDGYHRYNIFDKFMYHYFHRLLFWPEVEFHFIVERAIKENPNMDMLITIAYPHSIHSGAARAKKRNPTLFPKVWVADCGDPFMLNPFFHHPAFMKKYEDMWCSLADYIAVPTESSKDGYYSQYHNKIRVIPQGFDFTKTPISQYTKNTIPIFIFMGSIYPGIRDPHAFMDFLLKYDGPYKFKMLMRTPLEKKYEIESQGRIEYVIGLTREEVIMACSEADFLINVINPNTLQTPSKLIDYGIAKRPILDIDNEFSDPSVFLKFIEGDYSQQHNLGELDVYRIENVAQQFINLYDLKDDN